MLGIIYRRLINKIKIDEEPNYQVKPLFEPQDDTEGRLQNISALFENVCINIFKTTSKEQLYNVSIRLLDPLKRSLQENNPDLKVKADIFISRFVGELSFDFSVSGSTRKRGTPHQTLRLVFDFFTKELTIFRGDYIDYFEKPRLPSVEKTAETEQEK